MRRIAAQPRGLPAQLAIAVLCVLAATLVRALAGIAFPNVMIPFVIYFPALLLAGVLGGLRAGVFSLIGAAVAGTMFLGDGWPPTSGPAWVRIGTFLVSGGLIVALAHAVSGAFRSLEDARAQQQRLGLELEHRVKNTLAIVQAIALQTFQSAPDEAAFREAFTDRLVALGRAHNMLSEAAWRDIEMSVLVRQATEPFVPRDSQRIVAEGDPLTLDSQLVIDLALCLHELAVNATKHGALSDHAGRVSIRWRSLPGGRVELSWVESGGPTVSPPARRGFGSRLLEQGLSRRVSPVVAAEYPSDGVRWTAQFDAS